MNKKFYTIIISLFAALVALIFVLKQSDAFTFNVLMIGNATIFVLTLLSYGIGSKYTTSQNNGQFVRGVMGGSFLKFFLAIVFALIYIVVNKDDIKIADIMGLMLMYIIYTTIETVFLAKSSRTS